MYLEIHITFTAGHFHGQEWPPAPGRLFQALVAGSYRGAHGLFHATKRDEALQWLEAQAAPLIFASPLKQSGGHIVEYVPNNDNKRPAEGHVRAEKSMLRYAMPEGSRITYRWKIAEHDSGPAQIIAAMSSLVTYLGRTVDHTITFGTVLGEEAIASAEGRTCYHPVEETRGEWLIPATGFLAMLNERYPRSASDSSTASPDFTNSRFIQYRTHIPALETPVACYEIRHLRSIKAQAYSPRRVRELAGLIRGVMVKWGDQAIQSMPKDADRIAQLVHGHLTAAESEKMDGPHFAVVPLPSQNHSYQSDGWFRRVAIVGLGCQNEQDNRIFERLSSSLNNAVLMNQGKPVATLVSKSLPVVDSLGLISGSSRIWQSFTPIVLPSYPRRGRKPEDGVLRALRQAGYQEDQIESIATFTGPILPKTEAARSYYVDGQSYLGRYPRYHAEIIFKQPISAPLLLGSGRYAGLGLFAPA